MGSNSNVNLATEKVCTGLCTTVAFLFYPFYQLEKVESLIKLNMQTKKCSNLGPSDTLYVHCTT